VSRYGAQFGPDITFLGVDRCDWADPSTYADADVVILGGDHTIAWPDAAGVAQHVGEGRVSMVHFDAHADTGDTNLGSLIGHGQPMRRLIESGAV